MGRQALIVLPKAKVHQHFRTTMDETQRWPMAGHGWSLSVAALGVGAFALLIAGSFAAAPRAGAVFRASAPREARCSLGPCRGPLVGLIGKLIGVAIGVPVEWYIMKVILFEETGLLLPVLVPWTEAAAIAGTALVLATLAGLPPAWRTMNLPHA